MAHYKRYRQLTRQARRRHLNIMGGFHPGPADGFPEDVKTVLLLGPDEPRFWGHFETVPEYRDDKADPMDRWSKRIVDAWAKRVRARAYYPFGGGPHHPFYDWALKSGQCHISPVKLLVHDDAGLWISFRGALGLAEMVDLPTRPPSPCEACEDKPCKTACPVSALTPEGYDVDRCRQYLMQDIRLSDWNQCMAQGCAVRRVCPVSSAFGRRDQQSAFHMRRFLAK